MIEGNVVTELTEHEKKELGLATQGCIGHRNNARWIWGNKIIEQHRQLGKHDLQRHTWQDGATQPPNQSVQTSVNGFQRVITAGRLNRKTLDLYQQIHASYKFPDHQIPCYVQYYPWTPWIHAMRVVTSTYHQCIKISTAEGLKTIHISHKVTRLCYINELQYRQASNN